MNIRHQRHQGRQRQPRPAAGVVAAGVVAVVVAAGCSTGRSSDAASTSTPTAAATTSTTTVAQLEATIVDRWEAAQRASGAVAMDPTSAGAMVQLSDYFLDPELGFLYTQYTDRAHDGIKTIGTFDLGSPKVVSLTATQAIVDSCETDATALVYTATGKPLPGPAGDATPTPTGVRATLTVAPSGLWDVSNTTGTEGSCAGY